MPNEKSVGGFLQFLGKKFVQEPSDELSKNIKLIQGLGNTSPQTFPKDLAKGLMGALGVVSSPYSLANPIIEATGQATDPRLAQALSLFVTTKSGRFYNKEGIGGLPAKIEKATEKVAPVADDAASKVKGYFDKVFQRWADEAKGQAILNDLEDAGVSARTVSQKFWSETYDKLPIEVKKKFIFQLEKVSGGKIGSVIAKDMKTGEYIRAKTYKDLNDWLDLNEIEYLEGIERGYVSLMEYANRKYSQPLIAPQAVKMLK
jgi:hypothetical protein